MWIPLEWYTGFTTSWISLISLILSTTTVSDPTYPVPDCGHETPTCDFFQSQLPHLTALSGALPFKPSKFTATKSYTLPGQGNTPSLVPPTGHPQPRPQPQSHSPLIQFCSAPSFGLVGQIDTFTSSTPPAPSLLRPGKCPVRPTRFLNDYVLNWYSCFIAVIIVTCLFDGKRGRFFCGRGRKSKV